MEKSLAKLAYIQSPGHLRVFSRGENGPPSHIAQSNPPLVYAPLRLPFNNGFSDRDLYFCYLEYFMLMLLIVIIYIDFDGTAELDGVARERNNR